MNGLSVLWLGAVAVAGTFCALMLKKHTPELALLLTLVTGCLLLWRSRSALAAVIELLDELSRQAGLSRELLEPLVKTVGISILVRISSQLCKDGGMTSVAALLEMAGSLAALVAVTPLLRAVVDLIGGLL